MNNLNCQSLPVSVAWSQNQKLMWISYANVTVQVFLDSLCMKPEDYLPQDITEAYTADMEGKQTIKKRDRPVATYNDSRNWIIIWHKESKFLVPLPYSAKEIICGHSCYHISPKFKASA